MNLTLMRPEALWLIIPAILLLMLWIINRQHKQQQQDWIDAELANYMLDQPARNASRWWPWLVAVTCLGLIISIAGPSWKKIPQPVSKNQDALIILLDMSLSMNAEDIKPSRAIRAKQKVIDIVRQRRDGQTAIIAYSGLAHVVSPFTDDIETIEHLVGSLSPDIMPKLGSRPDNALSLSNELISAAGFTQAQILLITDGIQMLDIGRISDQLQPTMTLSVLAIGTEQGAPVRLANDSFLKDNQGNIIVPGLDFKPIQRLANQLDLKAGQFSHTDSDWQTLISTQTSRRITSADDETPEVVTQYDQWVDQGYWFAIVLVPLFLLLFRPKALLSLSALSAPLLSALMTATAVFWPATEIMADDNQPPADIVTRSVSSPSPDPSIVERWLSTPDQQGMKRFKAAPQQAADLFEDPRWKAQALYESQQYDQAEALFQQDPSAQGRYNLGNNFAQQGQYQQAIDAYQAALDIDPQLTPAKINKQRIEDLLKQQQQNDQQQNSNQSNSDNKQESGQQQDSDQQDSDQQESGQQGSNQQESGQQNNQSSGTPSAEQSQPNQSADSQSTTDPDQDNQDNSSDRSSSDIDQFSKDSKISGKEDNSDSDSTTSDEQTPPTMPPTSATTNQSEQSASLADETASEQSTDTDPLSREQQAALQNLLNRVEDNPGTLLQRKFLYQYRQSQDQQDEPLLW